MPSGWRPPAPSSASNNASAVKAPNAALAAKVAGRRSAKQVGGANALHILAFLSVLLALSGLCFLSLRGSGRVLDQIASVQGAGFGTAAAQDESSLAHGVTPSEELRLRRRAERQESLTDAWRKAFTRKVAKSKDTTAKAAADASKAQDEDAQLIEAAWRVGEEETQDQQLGVADVRDTAQVLAKGFGLDEHRLGEKVWVWCAPQWSKCYCNGRIRWGNAGKWQVAKATHTQVKEENEMMVTCAVGQSGLEDVRPGDNAKHCECEVTTGSDYYYTVNPNVFPKEAATPKGSRTIVGNCELFREAQRDGSHAQAVWEAMRGFCAMPLPGGQRAIDPLTLKKLMRVRVDIRFKDNYERVYDKEDWVPYAFVAAFQAPIVGDQADWAKVLIESVHQFSVHPIVIMNFGMAAPKSWDPKRFPRLVVLHCTPLPASAMRSPTFDKFRAMLLSRAKVGILMEIDSWVSPGVDNFFSSIEREITKEYPLPILPVHFIDKKPDKDDTTPFWKRFCPEKGKPCSLQTMRWGQAHPTWTYWALPFLGRWLRRHLRDETLFPRSDMKDLKNSEVRISDIGNDEDLLNVALWEEGATKNWCKFDIPDAGEYQAILRSGKKATACKTHCDNLFSDTRWFPKGIPKVYYADFHAVQTSESYKYMTQLANWQKEGFLPSLILMDGNFYQNGEELRKAHPSLNCLI